MQRLKSLLRIGLLVAMATSLSFATAQDSDDAKPDQDQDKQPELTIGSKAPQLDIEHWLSDNDGLFPRVKKFESDNIYVIDFWTTRSQASINMMHKMGDLQNEYDGKDVQIISVSIEELDTVEDFLERETFAGADDEPKMTFAELTRDYCLTTDPDESVWNDYYIASGRMRFPSTFIVGKTGLIEWIGNSARMTDPLNKIIADEWDRDEFKKKYIKEQAALVEERKNAVKLQRKLRTGLLAIREKVQDGDEAAAIEMLAEMIEDEELEPVKPMLKTMRLEFMVQEKIQNGDEAAAIEMLAEMIEDEELELEKPMLKTMRLKLMITSEHEEAVTAMEAFVEENKADASTTNSVTWSIYELYEENGGDVDSEILKLARKGAGYAAKAEPESGAILDTLAHYIYIVDEDLDKAIEVQRKAVEYAGPQLEDIQPFLDELLKEKETGKKKKEKVESDF